MSLDAIKDQITNLPETGYQEIRQWLVGPERRRRQQETGKAELVLEERKTGIRDAPAATVPEDQADDLDAYSDWEDPGVIHDRMYGLGDRVRHNGRIWESTTPGLNHWEPGGVGVYDNVWRDITETLTPEPDSEDEEQDAAVGDVASAPEIPEWQPGMAFSPGDQVRYDGETFTVVQGHTTQAGWEPPTVAALFTR